MNELRYSNFKSPLTILIDELFSVKAFLWANICRIKYWLTMNKQISQLPEFLMKFLFKPYLSTTIDFGVHVKIMYCCTFGRVYLWQILLNEFLKQFHVERQWKYREIISMWCKWMLHHQGSLLNRFWLIFLIPTWNFQDIKDFICS